MNKILLALAGSLMAGTFAVAHAKLPAPPPAPPVSDAVKAAEAKKAADAKAHDAETLAKAQDHAVMNYKKNKGMVMESKPAKGMKAAKKK
jgi:hypothetical protein